MLVIMAAGFGKIDNWIADQTVPPGHTMTFRGALHGIFDNVIIRFMLPTWITRPGGIGELGWLGKRIQQTVVSFLELKVRSRRLSWQGYCEKGGRLG